jgi:hypothetical protein
MSWAASCGVATIEKEQRWRRDSLGMETRTGSATSPDPTRPRRRPPNDPKQLLMADGEIDFTCA